MFQSGSLFHEHLDLKWLTFILAFTTAIAIPLCNATNGAINTAVVCALIGMIASYAYATPPAHPAVALAIGSEKTTTGQVLKLGITMMIIAVLVTVAVGYPLGVAVLG